MNTIDYPAARTVEQVDEFHGVRIADPYRWLEDADAPDTRAWIAAQNAATAAWLGAVPAREAIRSRLTQLWDHARAGAPWHRASRWFQMRNTGLQNQDVLWTMDGPDEHGRILIDANTLSPDGTVALVQTAVTDDGRLLAYATSASGSDWLTWRVREVATGEDLGDALEWSKFAGAAWHPDGSGFWYGRYEPPAEGEAYEQANRDMQLRFHRLGTAQDDDELTYARPDEPEWGFDPSVTEDGRYLVLHVWHGTHRENQLFYRDLERSEDDFVELLTGFEAAYHLVGSEGSLLYLLTDLDAPRGRVIAIDLQRPERSAWREVVPEAQDTLERARVVGGRIVAVYLHHAHHVIRLFDLDGGARGEVELPGIGTIETITGRQADPGFHFTFASFTAPMAVLYHDLDTARTALRYRPEIDADLDGLATEQVFVESGDGTRVPMFLVHRRDVAAGGQHPTLLWGYGGFNIPVTPQFKPEWLAWVELGGLLAVANLRGGGEYGEEWHDAGRLANKQNVFDDAIACAEWLIASGWTGKDGLGIVGRSNGGLLVGACMTQRPDLFTAAVPEVGVLDMLRFHTFTIGWAWVSDYGSPDDPEQFRTLLAYSPLHRVEPGTAYPATLVTTGDHDDRVVPGHSFKFAAALQAAQVGDAPVLIRIETQAGHGLGKPVSKLIAERADVLAFLAHTLGL